MENLYEVISSSSSPKITGPAIHHCHQHPTPLICFSELCLFFLPVFFLSLPPPNFSFLSSHRLDPLQYFLSRCCKSSCRRHEYKEIFLVLSYFYRFFQPVCATLATFLCRFASRRQVIHIRCIFGTSIFMLGLFCDKSEAEAFNLVKFFTSSTQTQTQTQRHLF